MTKKSAVKKALSFYGIKAENEDGYREHIAKRHEVVEAILHSYSLSLTRYGIDPKKFRNLAKSISSGRKAGKLYH